MEQLSDKCLAKRAILSYIELGALKDDALDQSVIACGKSLQAMAVSPCERAESAASIDVSKLQVDSRPGWLNNQRGRYLACAFCSGVWFS